MMAQHSSKSNRWFTPPWLVERVRRVLGTIDFDPASEGKANGVVGAAIYSDRAGHEYHSWPRGVQLLGATPTLSVFCNPPGGRLGRVTMPVRFWTNLMLYRSDEHLSHAVFLGFNTSILRTAQDYVQRPDWYPSSFPHCYPHKRIAFIRAETGEEDPHPRHDSVIIYVPGTIDNTAGFAEAFGDLGALVNCRREA